MKKIADRILAGFESSSGKTPEFKQFVSSFKKSFKKILSKLDAKDIKFSVGHFTITGFFTVNEQAYYFSLSDVRNVYGGKPQLLVRTATDYKDYSGGSNMYVSLDEDTLNSLQRTLRL